MAQDPNLNASQVFKQIYYWTFIISRKEYVGLEKTGVELLAVQRMYASRRPVLIFIGVIEKASFKRGQDLEIEKKYAESAQTFEVFAKTNPKGAEQAMSVV